MSFEHDSVVPCYLVCYVRHDIRVLEHGNIGYKNRTQGAGAKLDIGQGGNCPKGSTLPPIENCCLKILSKLRLAYIIQASTETDQFVGIIWLIFHLVTLI